MQVAEYWLVGLTLDELVSRTGRSKRVLELVLRDEIARGRVSVINGRYSLRPNAIDADVLQAVRGLDWLYVSAAFPKGRPRRRRSPAGGPVHDSEHFNLRLITGQVPS